MPRSGRRWANMPCPIPDIKQKVPVASKLSIPARGSDTGIRLFIRHCRRSMCQSIQALPFFGAFAERHEGAVPVFVRGSATPHPVSYTHLRAHETRHDLVCRLLLEKKK